MNKQMNPLKTISAFILITFLLTFCLLNANSIVAQSLSQATPAIAAFIVILFSKSLKKEIMELGLFRLGTMYWYLIAFALPFLAIVVSYIMASFFGYFSFNLKMPWYKLIYLQILLTFTWPVLFALAEEIGWRGFLQPKLTKIFGIRQGILITGIIWTVWHFIFIFFGDYYETGNPFINTVLFSVTILLMSSSIGWIRWQSQSIWPCILFHATSNTTLQICSYTFDIKNPHYIYMAGEAGLLLSLIHI